MYLLPSLDVFPEAENDFEPEDTFTEVAQTLTPLPLFLPSYKRIQVLCTPT